MKLAAKNGRSSCRYVNPEEAADAETLAQALNNQEITSVQITGTFAYDQSIEREISIQVTSGNTLTLNYSTDNISKESTVCDADISVENGAGIIFNQDPTDATVNPHLIFSGELTLEDGPNDVQERIFIKLALMG